MSAGKREETREPGIEDERQEEVYGKGFPEAACEMGITHAAFAQAASCANDTYLQAHFRRLTARRGVHKAVIGVAHSQFIRCVALAASPGEQYQYLGGDYFDRRNERHVRQRLVRRLEYLGYDVKLEPKIPAA